MAQVDNIIGYVKGPQGAAATIIVADVTTGDPGTDASVTNSGTSSDVRLNFTIPRGEKGDPGEPGETDYASTSKAGLVRIGDDFNINASTGVLSIKNAFTEASTLANINTGESQATILGKIKKFMTALMPSNFLINTTNSTATDKALTANMGKTLAGDLATVQTSNTASKAYSIGEYLVLNGLLYRVTAAIANGGTITPGTNVTATTAGAQLKSLNDSLVSLVEARLNGVFMKRLYKGSATLDAFTAPIANGRHILFSIDSNVNRCGAWFIYSNGSNYVNYKEIVGGSDMQVSASNHTISIAHTSGAPMYLDICLDGSGQFFELS